MFQDGTPPREKTRIEVTTLREDARMYFFSLREHHRQD